jgi:hypothetical protein
MEVMGDAGVEEDAAAWARDDAMTPRSPSDPRGDAPPVQDAAFDDSSAEDPHTDDPPTEDPPVEDPPAEDPPTCTPSTESCNGLDDDCDGAVDEGLATDHGVFAGCGNYRGLLDEALAQLDRNAGGASRYYAPTSAEIDGVVHAVPALIARAELYRNTRGVPLPLGTRRRILDQAVAQADAFVALEVSRSSAVRAARSTAGRSHGCRGWVDSAETATVGQYTTGQVLYGLSTLSRAIYEDPPPSGRAAFLSKAASYHDLVGEVIDHWMDEAQPNHFFTADEPAGRAHWFCDTEDRASCVRSDGQRLVKWNKQSWTWRAVAVWNDVANDHRGMGTTYRRIRAMRFTRWMKADMTSSSSPWSDSSPYVWHAWADHARTWTYIEDASHGAWDVGLMVDAWRGDWREWDVDDTRRIMGPGSAGRFRHTYMDNLARPDACVWRLTDGSHGDLLITGRRSALSEWVGVAAGDQAFLSELQEDITGSCEGYVLSASSAPRAVLGITRLFVEARAIRGE